jgi:hypothetical protein
MKKAAHLGGLLWGLPDSAYEQPQPPVPQPPCFCAAAGSSVEQQPPADPSSVEQQPPSEDSPVEQQPPSDASPEPQPPPPQQPPAWCG